MVANPTEGYGIFILLANITVFTVALRAMLRRRSVRGAICARSLTSELVDSASLDYRKHVKCRTKSGATKGDIMEMEN